MYMPLKYTVKYREVVPFEKPWYPDSSAGSVVVVAISSVTGDP